MDEPIKPRKIRMSKDVRDKRGYGAEHFPIRDHLQGRSDSFYIGSVPHHDMLRLANAEGNVKWRGARDFGMPGAFRDHSADEEYRHAQKNMQHVQPISEVKGPRNPSARNSTAN